MAILKRIRFQLTALALAAFSLAATGAEKLPTVPKWQRLELTLKSSRTYTNALQEAEVRVLFVSPLGETNRVYGFWDGGKNWRVRFQPTFPGRWTYYTMCSDTANPGLHEQTGAFLCTASKSGDRFSSRGPIQPARDQQHFEHADRSPFLWLGDAAWDAATTVSNWAQYVTNRAAQKFTTVQWKLPAATFTGRQSVAVNLTLAKQLDARIATANGAGVLNAIAPLWEINLGTNEPLPEDQAIVLLRYCVARWGADAVAWIIAFDCDSTGAAAARWQRIGRAVFNSVSHAPVVLFAADSSWALDGFRRERWVDALGFQTRQVTDENSLPWLVSGPLSLERQKIPGHPLLTLDPPPAGTAPDFTRRVLWWSWLLNTPAGVSCSVSDESPGATAQTLAPLHDFAAGKEFWRWQPAPQAVLNAPGLESPRSFIAALSTEARDFSVIYLPGPRPLELAARAVPMKSAARWFNPRTGETVGAKVTAAAAKYQFTTPDPGDWVLVIQASK
jgi:hypothetical protein